VKINNKFKVLNMNKLKIFLKDDNSDNVSEDLKFNDFSSDKLLKRARAKLINYKNAA